MAQGRSLWRQALQNFIYSLKPKKYWGELRGRDHFGTEYYEAPKSLQGLNRPSRWFAPAKEDNFTVEIPPEWEAWLRFRRKDPPTEEEIQKNLLKMRQTVENARKLEKPKPTVQTEPSIKPQFPTYEEYSQDIGSDKNK